MHFSIDVTLTRLYNYELCIMNYALIIPIQLSPVA